MGSSGQLFVKDSMIISLTDSCESSLKLSNVASQVFWALTEIVCVSLESRETRMLLILSSKKVAHSSANCSWELLSGNTVQVQRKECTSYRPRERVLCCYNSQFECGGSLPWQFPAWFYNVYTALRRFACELSIWIWHIVFQHNVFLVWLPKFIAIPRSIWSHNDCLFN